MASLDDYARALHGIRTNPSAVFMVAATEALAHLITSVDSANAIELSAITSAHAALMGDEPSEAAYAGRVRDMQNWIGGSDYSPRGALYLPPPPECSSPTARATSTRFSHPSRSVRVLQRQRPAPPLSG